MKSLDILIDMNLLDEQYHFLLDRAVPDDEMWEGILNLFETILEGNDGTD